MKRSEALPSKYFRAVDVTKPRVLVIDAVLHHKLVNGGVETEKPVCFFTDPTTGKRVPQGLVLAPTKWDAMEAATGKDDTDEWKGERVELFPDTTTFQGKRVPTIGIRKPTPKPKKAKATPDFNDDVPELV
jgi:hypothetical protein